jgi:hypothetical protein
VSTLRTYKPLRARKPLNRVSPKKFSARGEWHPQVKRATPAEMNDIRERSFQRSGGFCECGQLQDPPIQCGKRVTRFNGDPHHIVHRSKGGPDVLENILWVHRDHHDNIHGIPKWSKRA